MLSGFVQRKVNCIQRQIKMFSAFEKQKKAKTAPENITVSKQEKLTANKA